MVLTAVERNEASRRMSRQPQQPRGCANVPESLVEVKSKVSVLMEEPTDSGTSGTDRTSCTFTRSALAPFVAITMLLHFSPSQFCGFSGSCGHFQMSFLKKRLQIRARTRTAGEGKGRESWSHVRSSLTLCVDINHQFDLLFVALRVFTLQLSFVFQKMTEMLVAAFFWQPFRVLSRDKHISAVL